MLTLTKPEIDKYCQVHSEQVGPLLACLEQETIETMPLSIMLTGALEGRFLKLLVMLINAKRVLEIGMYTGYSALSMAEGLPDGGELITLDIDPQAVAFAKRFFVNSEQGKKILVMEGPALESIKQLRGTFDLVFIDADKLNYTNYYKAVLPMVRSGGLIVVDNVLYGGEALQPVDENARAIADFNEHVAIDKQVSCVMLPVRDGISIIRKK